MDHLWTHLNQSLSTGIILGCWQYKVSSLLRHFAPGLPRFLPSPALSPPHVTHFHHLRGSSLAFPPRLSFIFLLREWLAVGVSHLVAFIFCLPSFKLFFVYSLYHWQFSLLSSQSPWWHFRKHLSGPSTPEPNTWAICNHGTSILSWGWLSFLEKWDKQLLL